MRKWGLVITLFFTVVVLALLVPATLLLTSDSQRTAADIKQLYQSWGTWICVGIVIAGQFLLLVLKVDTTQKRLKPRTHILISAVMTGLFLEVLTVDIVFAVGFGVRGDNFLKVFPNSIGPSDLFMVFCIPWIFWGILFYRFCRDSSDPITRTVTWLFRGSVLELLIAVPAHVIVRRRNDCSAPAATSFGITSGIAIMLISFGPSVLLLYKKRLERYSRVSAGESPTKVSGPGESTS
jgi:hypothetical protein